MFSEFVRFELKLRLGKASTYVYAAVFFILGFLAITAAAGVFKGATVGVSAGGKRAFINCPFYIHMITNTYALFGIILMASMMGRAICRDYESRMEQLFFSKPIRKRDFLAGRFAGNFVVLLAIMACLGLGLFAGSHMPWIRPEVLGAYHLWYYLYPYAVGVIPNIFIVGGLSYALAILTRRMTPVYAAGTVLFMAAMVFVPALARLQQDSLAGLLDPFSSGILLNQTKHWTYVDQNTRLVPFRGVFLANRLLWVGFAGLALGVAQARFALEVPSKGSRRKDSHNAPAAS
jgi:ABC-2 type transport system permease protein